MLLISLVPREIGYGVRVLIGHRYLLNHVDLVGPLGTETFVTIEDYHVPANESSGTDQIR